MSPFVILGIPSNSTVAVAEKAYRKLAMKYHPDRQGGNEGKFKEVKAAWERIEGGYRDSAENFARHARSSTYWEKPEPPKGTWRDSGNINDILDEMKRANRGADPFYRQHAASDEYVANVGLREAFSGFNMVIPRVKGSVMQQCSVHIPPGTPHGYRGKYPVSDGSIAVITTRIDTGPYNLRGFADADNIFSAGMNVGDIELDHAIDAIDLIAGAWITVTDFLSEPLTVRVPAGFNPLHRLKIAGKGYYGWNPATGTVDMRRQDMYLKLCPVFNKPSDIAKQKIIDLYNSVQDMGPKDEG